MTTPWGTMARGKQVIPTSPKPQTNTLFYNSWGIPAYGKDKNDTGRDAKLENANNVRVETGKGRLYEKRSVKVKKKEEV